MISRRHLLTHLACVVSLGLGVLTGCSGDVVRDDSSANQSIQQAKSNLQRDTNPKVSEADRSQLAKDNAAFAFDLYHELSKQSDGNLFVSPTSISLALAMTYAGASGETASQMAQALHFSLPAERLHAAFNDLDLQLANRGTKPVEEDKDPLVLRIANAMWLQEGFPFRQPFLDTLAVNYGAGLNLLDFSADPDGSRDIINGWVADHTEQKIQNLLPADAINSMTRFVIANAIYFKGSWQNEFDEKATQQATFHAPNGDMSVAMMQQTEGALVPYTKSQDFQAVSLPYAGNEADMTIIVPSEGSFASVESQLTPDWLESLDEKMAANDKPLEVSLPKFSFTYEKNLAGGVLQSLGMKDAFDGSLADFSGMDGNRDLYIGGVYHKAYIGVDEDGTEAAAATAVVGELSAAPEEPMHVVVDRPFIILIRDKATGAVLFEGRVLEPSESE